MLHIRVSSLIFGRGETEFLPEVDLQLSRQVIVKDIITQAIEKQLSTLQKSRLSDQEIKKKMDAQYLEMKDIKEQQLSGKIALASAETPLASPLPRLEQEIAKALKSFKNNRFKIFVDGVEVMDSNEQCTLKESSCIKFVRLIPLVGG